MRFSRFPLIPLAALVLGAFAGCTCGTADSETPTGAGGANGSNVGGAGGNLLAGGGNLLAGGSNGCKNLECQKVQCGGGKKTTVSGTVYSPKGDVPLYNVVVYVPNAPLAPIPDGASCDTCGATLSGSPIASTITDTKGQFTLENVPVGKDIPLVIQVGKWRREITIPTVAGCVDNPITDVQKTRLPKNQAEGHIPRIALTTGKADPLECLLRKIGIDDSEFTNDTKPGRIHLFTGSGGSSRFASTLNGGAAFSSATSLWKDVDSLKKYDVLLLACEGGQVPEMKPASARQAMFDYTKMGGRVFASHWHNYWLQQGPAPFPETATFTKEDDLKDPSTALIDTSFPKGEALADWLFNVGGSTKKGEIVIRQGQHTVNDTNDAISRQWIYSTNPQSVQYFTFNTPIDVAEDKQCGRVVFSDIHVSALGRCDQQGSPGDKCGQDFPSGCTTETLSAQEKALLFMLFDLSACVMSDEDAPAVPK